MKKFLFLFLLLSAVALRAEDVINYGPTESAKAVEREEKLRATGPRIGMSSAECLIIWGRPLRINNTTRATGVFSQWVYSGGRYLYFENGVLVSIQN